MSVTAAIDIPARFVLDYPPFIPGIIAAWSLTLLFAVDIVLSLHQDGWFGQRRSLCSFSSSTLRYSIVWLVIDLIAALPYGVLPIPTVFQLLRLLKLVGVIRRMWKWQHSELNNPIVVRIFFWLSISVHWIACGWLAYEWSKTPRA